MQNNLNPDAFVVDFAFRTMDNHELGVWISESDTMMRDVWKFNVAEFDPEGLAAMTIAASDFFDCHMGMRSGAPEATRLAARLRRRGGLQTIHRHRTAAPIY